MERNVALKVTVKWVPTDEPCLLFHRLYEKLLDEAGVAGTLSEPGNSVDPADKGRARPGQVPGQEAWSTAEQQGQKEETTKGVPAAVRRTKKRRD